MTSSAFDRAITNLRDGIAKPNCDIKLISSREIDMISVSDTVFLSFWRMGLWPVLVLRRQMSELLLDQQDL